ncbi:integrase, catalytic region, zinc finger, CCHC-type containing protein [Tanacetum coccineum]
MYRVHIRPNPTRTTQLPQDIKKTNKHVSFSTGVIPTTSVSRPQLKSTRLEDRVMHNISQGKKQEVEDHRTVKFGNDQIALIIGYGDLVQRNVTIKKVYYVEGLNHNLFSVGQFCDADLKVAFQKSTCYIRDLKGNDLLTGSRGTNLYSITLQDTSSPNSICLMAKASSSQAWLWHRHFSHLNFDTINLLSNYDIVTGLPKLKFVKDHLCSSCELGKAKHKSFMTKTTLSSKRRLQLLHMTLCGSKRVESINDGENLDKIKEKGDACIFVGYSTQSKGYRVYNKRTRVIVETIHVNFNELPLMVSDHVSSDPVPQSETVTTSNELDLLFTLMFDELFIGSTPVVSKSFGVPAADAPDKLQQQNTTLSTPTTVAADTPPLNIQTSPEPISQAPTVTNTENINQVEIQVENAQVDKDEFSTSSIRRYMNKGRHLLDMLIRQSCIHSINDILLNTVGQEITC